MQWPWQALTRLQQQVTALEKEVATMATQADVDALTARITALETRTTTAVTAITAEIVALQGANPSLDLTGLTTAVGTLETDVTGVEALETPPPPVAP
jgi:hypothetical protein